MYIIPAVLLMIASCGGNPSLTINGKTDGEAENVIILSGKDTLATVPVVDGAFTASVPVEKPGFLYIMEGGRRAGAVVAEAGTVDFEKAGTNFTISGTSLNDIYNAYRVESAKISDEYYSTEDPALQEAAEKKMEKLDNDFFENNVSNWLGVYALSSLQYGMTGEELEEALARLDPKFAEDNTYIKLKEKAEILKKTAVGMPYIEIALPSPDGEEIKLSDVIAANKYVLIDFWASWCGPCMGEVPFLVQDYADYHAKGFEIYGVSLDRTKEAWTGAIENKNLSWIHVSDIKYWECAAAKAYGVNAIPSNYLVDNNGTIVAVDLRGEKLSEKLAELLGE